MFASTAFQPGFGCPGLAEARLKVLHLPIPLASSGLYLNYFTSEKAFYILGTGEWIWEDLKASLACLAKKKNITVLAGTRGDL